MPAIPKTRRTDRRGAAKGKCGQQAFVATDQQRIEVAAMVAAGGTQPIVARHLGISEDTLQRHFRVELDTGTQFMLARIGGKVFEAALAGDNASRFFILKCRGGWREVERHEHTGADGGPIVSANIEQIIAALPAIENEC